MELFAITGVLALSLIFALLAASAALKLIFFLMLPHNAVNVVISEIARYVRWATQAS
jgi:multisubunit Na+/H+ antiporter MnhC subunit